MSLSKAAFNKLKLSEKFEWLTNEGDFIASRHSDGCIIHLFSLGGEYVEMWMKAGIDQPMWIEFLPNTETLKMYAEQFDPKKDLGL